MRIGLTGGIASGKTIFENEFRNLGYPLFDVDKVDFSLRSGVVKYDQDDDVFRYKPIVNLIEELAIKTIANLKEKLPNLYSVNGEFIRKPLLDYINDAETGSRNYDVYNRVINPSCVKIYLEWSKLVKADSVLSSGVLIERGNLQLLDSVYIIQISDEMQLRNLLKREIERGSYLSEEEARKAINRNYNFERRICLARRLLGGENVHILQTNSTLADKIPPHIISGRTS